MSESPKKTKVVLRRIKVCEPCLEVIDGKNKNPSSHCPQDVKETGKCPLCGIVEVFVAKKDEFEMEKKMRRIREECQWRLAMLGGTRY